MVHIKFTLEDCKITYECTGIDERLRGKLRFFAHIDNELFCIKSIDYIELVSGVNTLWLRGSCKWKDNVKFENIYNNNNDRDNYISTVKQAFKELKIYLKEQYPDDYTEPTFTVISEKTIDNKKDDYEYLTAESLKEILNSREEYITNTIIKTIDKSIRERMLQGCDWFYMFPEDFKVSTENKEIRSKVTEHFSNIGIGIEWGVYSAVSITTCIVKVVK